MSIFKRVSMKDIRKYVEIPNGVVGMQCQLNVNGPQFYEAKSNKGRQKKKGKNA